MAHEIGYVLMGDAFRNDSNLDLGAQVEQTLAHDFSFASALSANEATALPNVMGFVNIGISDDEMPKSLARKELQNIGAPTESGNQDRGLLQLDEVGWWKMRAETALKKKRQLIRYKSVADVIVKTVVGEALHILFAPRVIVMLPALSGCPAQPLTSPI